MDRNRYSRQMILEGFGVESQRLLQDARVLVVGLGGLGSASALYLAMAGVGRLRLMDGDVLGEPDLNRQVLYGEADLNKPKARAAQQRLKAVNSTVEVEAWDRLLGPANLREAIDGIDLIVDGSDNLATRHLMNRAYVTAKVPVVFAGATGYAGYVLVCAQESPCFNCVWTERPASTCDEVGIFGPLAGTIGSAQACEAIKIVTGVGQALRGRLLLFNSLTGEAKTVRVAKKSDCPSCGGARG